MISFNDRVNEFLY